MHSSQRSGTFIDLVMNSSKIEPHSIGSELNDSTVPDVQIENQT